MSRLFSIKYSKQDYNKPMRIPISEKIKELRIERGYTQTDLAKLVGVKQSCVSKWERGATLPDSDMIVSLCKLFQISSDYLLGLTDY